MATTEEGVYYQDNYEAEGDILADMKQMAKSVDEALIKTINKATPRRP